MKKKDIKWQYARIREYGEAWFDSGHLSIDFEDSPRGSEMASEWQVWWHKKGHASFNKWVAKQGLADEKS